jgi:hypothetical protein
MNRSSDKADFLAVPPCYSDGYHTILRLRAARAQFWGDSSDVLVTLVTDASHSEGHQGYVRLVARPPSLTAARSSARISRVDW